VPNSTVDEQRINTIRFLAVDAVQKANSGHPGMPLGAAATAYTIWSRHLRYNPTNPHWFNRDRFVLSAGHASALLYALLHLAGYDLSLEDLKSFRQLGSRTPGHPEYQHTAGVEVTTGPLGQGVGNAVGMAMAEAHLGAVYNRGTEPLVDHYTYVMAGDGDMMEGISSEASSIAGHVSLGKLILFYDDNKVTLAGPAEKSFNEDVGMRYAAYGWHVQHVEAGEEVEAIDKAIIAAKAVSDKPSIIIVRTTIGFGSPRAGTSAAHGEPLGADNVAKTKEALNWPLQPAFLIPADVAVFWRERAAAGAKLEADWNAHYDKWKVANATLAAQFERTRDGKLPDTIPWPTFNAENGSVATRESGSTIMNAIASALPELVGGSADLDPSTKTYLKGAGDFEPGTYDGRNMHFGVREHAMAAAINGIALHGGLLPFCATFFNSAHSTKFARSTSSRTTRCGWAKTAPRTNRSSSSQRCARHRTSASCVRPMHSKRSKPGNSPSNPRRDRGRSSSRGRNCRSSATAQRPLTKARISSTSPPARSNSSSSRRAPRCHLPSMRRRNSPNAGRRCGSCRCRAWNSSMHNPRRTVKQSCPQR